MGLILMIVVLLMGALVGWRFKQKFKKFSKIPIGTGLTGKDIALKMLSDNGIYDVQVMSVQGSLSDHYNPLEKTVNLSPEVYHGRSVAAAAVAAHECGHAVQHAQAYSWLYMRSALVPAVSISSKFVPWLLLGGILTMSMFPYPYVLLAGIILFALTTLFSFVTLPVEFDASNRALKWLDHAGVTTSVEHNQAKNALKWAAMTYVSAALASLMTLLYYVMIFLNRN